MLKRSYIILFLLIPIILISGCKENKESSPVTLYKYSVDKGNGVVSLVVWHDSDGKEAQSYCEKLEKILEKEDGINYSCSKFKDNDFIPNIKWK